MSGPGRPRAEEEARRRRQGGGLGSLVVVILGVAFFVYQRGLGGGVMGGPGGRRNPYTLVMKQGDV